MKAKELINHMIPPLKMSDNAQKAMMWMEELRTSQLPVIDNGAFKGLISEDVILEENDLGKLISEYELIAPNCYVNEEQHFYDSIKCASDNKVHVVAVLDDNNQYCGVITVEDTVSAFAQTAAVQSSGGILILSLNQRDYSLAEISRLVESNNSKILSSCISTDLLDPQKIKLTIKINKQDLSHIIATLERFGYKIIARFQENQAITNEKDRLDMLMKYLSI
jgi:acetoin utilization protein AcuB